jgi:antitoxin ParD1/3/4
MPTQNVNLPEHLAQFIRDRVGSGRYQNASEVVRAGLRLLEQFEAEGELRLQALKRAADESFSALDRGESSTFTTDTLDEYFGAIDRKTRAR